MFGGLLAHKQLLCSGCITTQYSPGHLSDSEVASDSASGTGSGSELAFEAAVQ